MSNFNVSNMNFSNNLYNHYKGEMVNDISIVKQNEFLQKKTKGDEKDSMKIGFQNFKKKRFDEFPNDKQFKQKDAKFNSKTQIKFLSSVSSLVHQNKINSIIGNAYNDNKLKSMSHIKQLNPKYKNFIIPVLPGSINKF